MMNLKRRAAAAINKVLELTSGEYLRQQIDFPIEEAYMGLNLNGTAPVTHQSFTRIAGELVCHIYENGLAVKRTLSTSQACSEALAIIRKTNPARTVIIGPGHWNGIGYLEQLELPKNDRNIIVTVHYYSPMEFTHQGASWSSSRDKIGIEWNATAEEKQAVIKDFGKAQAWSEKHDRPLFLGEFGAYDKADMDSRVRYVSFVTRHAEKLGWSWAYWQFDSDFVVYDIPNDKWVEPIRGTLIPSE